MALLQRLGVVVLDPARAAIGEQMARYAGAVGLCRGLVPAWGQLLGRVDQAIAVLRRRPGKVMAKAALVPRCLGLTYHDVTAGQLMA